VLRVKRIYEPASAEDGVRVLVDRMWPRGVKKSEAAVDLWLKDVAPSTELRTWFSHDPAKWAVFRRRYHAELQRKADAIALLQGKLAEGPVTLIFSARDPLHNNAVALEEYLEEAARPRHRTGKRTKSRTAERDRQRRKPGDKRV